VNALSLPRYDRYVRKQTHVCEKTPTKETYKQDWHTHFGCRVSHQKRPIHYEKRPIKETCKRPTKETWKQDWHTHFGCRVSHPKRPINYEKKPTKDLRKRHSIVLSLLKNETLVSNLIVSSSFWESLSRQCVVLKYTLKRANLLCRSVPMYIGLFCGSLLRVSFGVLK